MEQTPDQFHPKRDTESMPALDTVALGRLRFQQIGDAEVDWRCAHCDAQIWHNYCREHDEYFVAGHLDDCQEASHQTCAGTY